MHIRAQQGGGPATSPHREASAHLRLCRTHRLPARRSHAAVCMHTPLARHNAPMASAVLAGIGKYIYCSRNRHVATAQAEPAEHGAARGGRQGRAAGRACEGCVCSGEPCIPSAYPQHALSVPSAYPQQADQGRACSAWSSAWSALRLCSSGTPPLTRFPFPAPLPLPYDPAGRSQCAVPT